jgi:hypothetical protein
MMVVVMKTSVTDLARISFREWSPNSNPKRINLQESRFDNHMYIDTTNTTRTVIKQVSTL